MEQKAVSVVGAGLVGSLAAVFFAKRGYDVHVYEARPDIRLDKQYEGRSINMALSERGVAALREVGLAEEVIADGIPMKGRMIHSLKGDLTSLPYGVYGEAILSVDRKRLNATLLTAAEKYQNVNLHFEHRCKEINFDNHEITFQTTEKDRTVHSDMLVGTDGAFSSVRKSLMRKIRMNYSQEYIGHGYKELTIKGTDEGGEYRMDHSHLHIWPRHTFMMIALPNKDKSFTCTLFMPYENFEAIKTPEQLLAFFEREFPDAIPLMGQENLVHDYFNNPVGELISIKCNQYHYSDFAVILGDAAHAMVPFYGQGMNCGFQDVHILDEILQKHPKNTSLALQEYSKTRNPDAEAICDLAMDNYIEMRSTVASPFFALQKKVDAVLNRLFPSKWIPLYSMVAFTEIPYSEVRKRSRKQAKHLHRISLLGTLSVVTGALAFSITKFNLIEKSRLYFYQ